MSYLSRPVFHFTGRSYANPSTANNNDFADVFDVDTLTFKPSITPIPGATVTEPQNQQTVPYTGPSDSPLLRTWLKGLMKGIGSQEGGPDGQPAHWNYYGDHATRFDNATVNSAWARPGVTVPSTDPLLGASVQITGNIFFGRVGDPVMVDVDPYALITNQIFSAGITVTGADGTVLINAPGNNRAFSYFINPHKNTDPAAIGFQMVSAVFQCAVPSSPALTINTANSPALADLASAVQAGAGLVLRYCFYDAIYATSPQDLYASFAKGVYVGNPYQGSMIGTIGVLQPGELTSAPAGRKLYVQTPFQTNATPCSANASCITLGEALASVDTAAQSVTLDLVSTFPECSVQTNEKLDLGTMNLVVVPASGAPLTIGAIPYDQTTYQGNGGMVEVSYAGNANAAAITQAIGTGSLAIQGLTPVTTVLQEVPDIDVQTDDRAVYFQLGVPQPNGPTVPGTATITIHVYRKGVLAQTATTLDLEYWVCQRDFVNPDKPMIPVTTRYFTVNGATAQPNTPYSLPYYGGASGPVAVEAITDQITVPAGGVLTLTLTAVNPGVSVIRFRDAAQPARMPNFAWDNEYYAIARILPTDDYSSYTDAQINNWPFIYQEVFCYFAVLYPIMSTFIPWGPTDAPDDPQKVAAFANNMIQMTDPAFWDSTVYMPITRELSAGKRALLLRWCQLQQ